MKYSEQIQKGLVPVSMYVPKETKARWKEFADEHGISLTTFLTQAADAYIQNINNPTPSARMPEATFTKLERETLMKAIERIPVMEAKLSSLTQGGFTFHALANSTNLKERISDILQSHRHKGHSIVIKFDAIKASFPDIIDENILYNTLSELMREGRAEKTQFGWRSL